ncbi:hypothetical protein [Microbacterium maritypicum]
MRAWGRARSFDLLVAQERGDLAKVVIDDQDRDEDLRGRDAANSAAASGLDVRVARCLELIVPGLDGVAGVVVEGLPLLGAVVEGLL